MTIFLRFQDPCTVCDSLYQIPMHVKSVARTHGQGLSLRNLECRTCREKLWSLWLVVGRVSALSSIAAYSWCFWCWNIHGIYLSACTTFIWNHTHTLTAHWKRWRPRWTGLTTWLLIGRDEFICRPGHFVQKSQKWPPGAFRHFQKIYMIIWELFLNVGPPHPPFWEFFTEAYWLC